MVDVATDSQMMTLARLESLKACQLKLVDKNEPYDYVTVTDSIIRNVENHFSNELPGIMWNCEIDRITSEAKKHRRVDLTESAETRNGNMTCFVTSDKQVEVTGSVASDKQVEVTGSVTSDKQVDVTDSMASDKQVEVTGSVASDKQVEVTDSMASDKQVEVTGSVTSDKQVDVTDSMASDKQVEVTGSVASDKQVEVTGSVASDKQVEVTGSVASDKQVEMTGSVASDKQVEVTGSVASDKQVEVTGSVASDKQLEVTGSVASDKQVEVTGSVASEKEVDVTDSMTSDKQVEVKEVSRIRLVQDDPYGRDVSGMVVYNQRVYVVHGRGLTVYCYTPDGSLSRKFVHPCRGNARMGGMSLVMVGETAMLVVSDKSHRGLVWIKIIDDVTMEHHHTHHLDYNPTGSYNDKGNLLVCDCHNCNLYRYKHDGQTLAIINLPDDIRPYRVTRHFDSNHYVVSDYKELVIIDRRGQIKKRYKDEIHCVKLGSSCDVITDPHGGVLIADDSQVLLLRRAGDVVKILDQHVISPRILYLDSEHHRLYVSGRGQNDMSGECVFVFRYTLKELTMNITKLDMKADIDLSYFMV